LAHFFKEKSHLTKLSTIGRGGRGIWFFLPIGLMLVGNAFIFVLTIIMLSKLDRDKRRLNFRSASKRSEKMEK